MSSLRNYLDGYAARNPGWRERSDRLNEQFFGGVPDAADLSPACSPTECTEDHPALAGPNMDIGQCASCWMPVGAMRPYGESFGWHIDDCSLPMRHAGYCKPGGSGHAIPHGWKLRG